MAEKKHTGQSCVNSEISVFRSKSSTLYCHQTPTRRYGHASPPMQSLPITGQRNMQLPPLGNDRFDHRRAEITVMQFISHPLPVHHFVTAPWDFNLVPYCQPNCISQYLLFEFLGYTVFQDFQVLSWLYREDVTFLVDANLGHSS